MTSGIAVFLKIYDHSPAAESDGIQAKWQNFFVSEVVDGFTYESFNVSDVVLNRSADEGGITVEMAALAVHLNFFTASIDAERLLEITMYEMDCSGGIPSDIEGAPLVSRFVGEIISLSTNLTKLTVEVGAAIDAVSGEIPGRRVTTSVVGRLPTL